MTFITTIISAITLPFIGSILDQLNLVKTCLLFSEYAGILFTFAILSLKIMPSSVQVSMFQVFYIFGMFFLRVGVMNNNAILAYFPADRRVSLSLLSNFTGFSVNFAGLLALTFLPPDFLNPIQWVGIFSAIVLLVSPLTFWQPNLLAPPPSIYPAPAPSGRSENSGELERERLVNEERSPRSSPPFRTVLYLSFMRIVNTLKLVPSDSQHRAAFLFLFAYLFFCAASATFTVFLSTFFLKIYSLSFQEEAALNLYFKISMLCGILIGFLYERVTKGRVSDYLTLSFHNVLFIAGNLGLYLVIYFGQSRDLAYMSSFLIGGTYGWNVSISRGMMSKLIPKGKSSEFMALYSTFTYVGIALVSFIYRELISNGINANVLPLMLAACVLPSYIFLILVYREQKSRQEQQQ
eukprot:TRINITY_DN9002_c0_g1_i1.p1 TRINITY_DN9002_c0_g1~~TRINITY_DN9002_c0_g1_i1.p1  ORF type:complete len:479 (+),score=89.78 TRINITY_DN9002_c0_g1_i1:214-1437(+)